jgi:hypothetical protein
MQYYAHKSGVRASCHHLRHTMATQMYLFRGVFFSVKSLNL